MADIAERGPAPVIMGSGGLVRIIMIGEGRAVREEDVARVARRDFLPIFTHDTDPSQHRAADRSG
ncbi:hypothetical protein LTR94_037769, partial [Friedmanniomyces endolithicus]